MMRLTLNSFSVRPVSLAATMTVAALSFILNMPMAAHAQVLYNNVTDFNNAVTTTQFFDFEGIAPANDFVDDPDLSPLTINISGGDDPHHHLPDSQFASGGFSLNGTDSLVVGFSKYSVSTVTIGSGSSITAFGTEIGFANGDGLGLTSNSFTAQLFDGNTAVGSVFSSSDATLYGTSVFTSGFLGVTSSVAFDRIKITTGSASQNDPAFQVYDNVRTNAVVAGVPEAGTLALVLPALGIIGVIIAGRKTN